jgi:hypothetical protein
MTTAGTLEDQYLMTEGENLCPQTGPGSQAISHGKKQSEHGLERLPVATP